MASRLRTKSSHGPHPIFRYWHRPLRDFLRSHPPDRNRYLQRKGKTMSPNPSSRNPKEARIRAILLTRHYVVQIFGSLSVFNQS